MKQITSQPSVLPPQPEELHLHDYLQAIIHRRKTFFGVFCLVFAVVAACTFLMKPIFQATATIHVKAEKNKADLLGALGVSPQSPIDTEIVILTSRSNAEQVVKRLHLDWRVTDKSKGVDFQLVEFSPLYPNSPYKVELTAPDAYLVRNADGQNLGTGRSGVLFQGKGIRLLINILRGKPGDSFELACLPFNSVVESLRSKIKAVEVNKKTDVMGISYADTDRVRARDVVNTLLQAYLEQNVGFKTQDSALTVNFVEGQLKGLSAELDKAEKNLQSYKSSVGVMDVDAETQALIGKIADAESKKYEALLLRKQLEFAITALKEAMKQGKLYTPSVMRDDSGVAGLAGKMADLEVQKRALQVDSTEAHPQVRAMQAQISEVQSKLLATYETALKNTTKSEADLTRLLNGYEAQMKRLPEAERHLAGLMRPAKVNADLYSLLLQKREEASIAKASTISNIDIVDPAILPEIPIKPKKLQYLLLGLLAGIVAGVGAAFFHDYMDDTVRDEEHAKRLFGFPILGNIPHIGAEVTSDAGGPAALVAYAQPKSAVAESFRSLRTNIHFTCIAQEKKVLLITSTFPGEGKSTVSTNLAITVSQTGLKVLIVDGDLRRPSLHTRFGHSKEPGLSDILVGDCTVAAAIHTTGITGLDFISAGTTPPNPAELLGSRKMRDFLEAMRGEYDFVIVDAPPVLAVTDAPMLTEMVDIAALVMEVGRVPQKAAIRTVETLRNLNAPIAGLALNDKNGRAESYGYYAYRYGYGDYGYYDEGDSVSKAKKPLWKRLLGKM